jgi:hypothetical protein
VSLVRWLLLAPGGAVSLLEPEHAKEGCVLTGGLERRSAWDTGRRFPQVTSELPSGGNTEKGREQEHGQVDCVHRAFIALLDVRPEHAELAPAPARRVSVYTLGRMRPHRGGDPGSGSGPGKKDPGAEQEGGDRYERQAANEPPG